jgi:hypothetical protein
MTHTYPTKGESMIDHLQKLRDKWTVQAQQREASHGEDDPAAKALRKCAGELHATIRDNQSRG